jgi:outer membrane protein OmpA-like peptidoglycan-associated protein
VIDITVFAAAACDQSRIAVQVVRQLPQALRRLPQEQQRGAMLPSGKIRKRTLAPVAWVAGLALAVSIAPASAAERLSAEDIIQALKPPRITRGLTTSSARAQPSAEETRFIDTLRNRATRSLSSAERDRIVAIAKSRPNVDLEINFEFNSAVIGARALPQMTALGDALTSADLKGRTFILAGHTDAKGSETYNQGLSERRAEAVKRFLSEKYGIEGANLVTVGYGKTQLKNSENPLAGENRRVQVVNAADR